MNLAGWRLDWGAGSHTLTGTLPARGFLIVTNDLKNDQDKTPEENQTGMGSFYDVFRRLPNGTSEQILEVPELDLQNNSIGRVSLRDQAGHLIDYLTFRSAAFTGQNRGYRKSSPFSHIGVAAPASPFADDTPKLSDPYEIFCWDILQACMDQPFHSVAEILTVPVFFAQAGAAKIKTRTLSPCSTPRTTPLVRAFSIASSPRRNPTPSTQKIACSPGEFKKQTAPPTPQATPETASRKTFRRATR